MSYSPTPQQVVDFWHFMTRHFGTTIVPKNRSWLMRASGWVLDRLSIMPRDDFDERFATTIGNRIYVPFTPGVPTPAFSLWGQITICVHEHHHVTQFRREGFLPFSLRYLLSRRARMAYEVDAYITNMEMTYWRTGTVLSVLGIVRSLSKYALGEKYLAVARSRLHRAADHIEAGEVLSPVTATALAWLRMNMPELGDDSIFGVQR
jgi:hypothetical protein